MRFFPYAFLNGLSSNTIPKGFGKVTTTMLLEGPKIFWNLYTFSLRPRTGPTFIFTVTSSRAVSSTADDDDDDDAVAILRPLILHALRDDLQ